MWRRAAPSAGLLVTTPTSVGGRSQFLCLVGNTNSIAKTHKTNLSTWNQVSSTDRGKKDKNSVCNSLFQSICFPVDLGKRNNEILASKRQVTNLYHDFSHESKLQWPFFDPLWRFCRNQVWFHHSGTHSRHSYLSSRWRVLLGSLCRHDWFARKYEWSCRMVQTSIGPLPKTSTTTTTTRTTRTVFSIHCSSSAIIICNKNRTWAMVERCHVGVSGRKRLFRNDNHSSCQTTCQCWSNSLTSFSEQMFLYDVESRPLHCYISPTRRKS